MKYVQMASSQPAKQSPRESILKFFTPKRKRSDTSSSSSPPEALEKKRSKEASPIATLAESAIMEEELAFSEISTLVATEVNNKLETIFDELKIKTKEAVAEALVTVENLLERVTILEAENATLKARVETLEENRNRTTSLGEVPKDILSRLVHLEQYSRKSNIRIFGAKEEQGENCRETVVKLLNNKLNMHLTSKNIDAAHRLPSQNVGPKPNIVRFMARDDKNMAMRYRSNLKGSGVTVAEDLCKDMARLLNRASNHEKVKDAWAWNGNIFMKDFQDKVHRLEYGESIDDMQIPPAPEGRQTLARPRLPPWKQRQTNSRGTHHLHATQGCHPGQSDIQSRLIRIAGSQHYNISPQQAKSQVASTSSTTELHCPSSPLKLNTQL